MQKYTKMFIFELYTFCVLYVHKFVYELCVHIGVYSNVYLLYTISTRVCRAIGRPALTPCLECVFAVEATMWNEIAYELDQLDRLVAELSQPLVATTSPSTAPG